MKRRLFILICMVLTLSINTCKNSEIIDANPITQKLEKIVYTIPAEQSNETTLVINLDSLNKIFYGIGSNIQIMVKFRLLEDTLYYFQNRIWNSASSFNDDLEGTFYVSNDLNDSIKFEYISTHPINKQNKSYCFVISGLGYNEISLLVLLNEKLRVTAYAVGATPGTGKFDYLFYDGQLDELASTVYLKRVDKNRIK